MEKESITICGRKFKKSPYPENEGTEYEYYEYYNNFKTKQQIVDWYDKVLLRDDILETNFRGSPFQWASYIDLAEIDGYSVRIHPPRASNSDTNWYSYKEDFGFYTTLTMSKKTDE